MPAHVLALAALILLAPLGATADVYDSDPIDTLEEVRPSAPTVVGAITHSISTAADICTCPAEHHVVESDAFTSITEVAEPALVRNGLNIATAALWLTNSLLLDASTPTNYTEDGRVRAAPC